MLTPERRAELRGLAESAQPFIRHGGTDPAAVYVPAAELTALLDAADERDRLTAVIPCDERYTEPYDFAYCEAHDRTFALGSHCDHAGLSEVDYLGERERGQRVRAIRAEDERDRLAAQVEQVRALHVPCRIYDECECEDTTTPGHVDVEEVGITCNLLHIACRECCTSGVDIRYQTEDCANGHDHRDTQCPTIAALDGPHE